MNSTLNSLINAAVAGRFHAGEDISGMEEVWSVNINLL